MKMRKRDGVEVDVCVGDHVTLEMKVDGVDVNDEGQPLRFHGLGWVHKQTYDLLSVRPPAIAVGDLVEVRNITSTVAPRFRVLAVEGEHLWIREVNSSTPTTVAAHSMRKVVQ